jgi:hypothetical protein
MMRQLLVSETFAPVRRLGAFMVVFGGFLVGPMIFGASGNGSAESINAQMMFTAPLPPAVISARINQVWRTETALRRGDVQMAEAAR